MKARPNYILRAVGITLVVAFVMTLYGFYSRGELGGLGSPEGFGTFLGTFVASSAFYFVPVGLCVLVWSVVDNRLAKLKKDKTGS